MKAKFITLFASCIALCSSSYGQVRFDPTDPYNLYSVGINVGYTTMYGDLKQSNAEPAFIANISRHMTPYVTIGFEAQHGTLSSTEPANKWTTGLSMTNQFNAFNINAKVTLGQLLKDPKNIALRTLSNLYIGAGVGLIDNDITSITNKFKTTDVATIDPDFKKSSLALVVPMNLGLNIYLKRLFGYNGALFNVNYQLAYGFSDYIDGYKFQSSTSKNKYNDMYSILSVGLAIYIDHVDDNR